MSARGKVRLGALILALGLAGGAARAAPAPAADPTAALDALLAESDPAPATPPAPVQVGETPPDIISGVVVQAPPVHKQPATADEYSWAWNGSLHVDAPPPPPSTGPVQVPAPMSTGYDLFVSIHFGLNPTIVTAGSAGDIAGPSPTNFNPPGHILWRRSGNDIQIIVPRSENWWPEGKPPKPPGPAYPPYPPTEWVFSGKLSADGDAINGSLACNACAAELTMAYFKSVLLKRWGDADPPGPPQTPLAADEERISIDAGRGQLAGTYRNPPSAAAGPAVLILPGTGPVNGDGDSMLSGPGPGNLRLIAEALDKAGYRSLRFDKRGIGDSSHGVIPKDGLKITDLVDDAANWARYLAGEPNVTCVVLLGHSEGAMVAMLAAQKVPVCGLISLSSPGRPLGDTLSAQVQRADLPGNVKAQFTPILASLKAGTPVASVPAELSGMQPDAQPFLMSQINLDPASLIRDVKAPVLIIQGDNDMQVSVDDAKRLAAAKPGAQLLIVKTMNNATKSAPTLDHDNIARGLELHAPLAAPVMPAVIAFLKQAKP